MDMLERLLLVLASIGLELNVSRFSKPKILTNACLEETRFAEVAGGFTTHGEHKYKHSGTNLTGDVFFFPSHLFPVWRGSPQISVV